jgi:hypothetical protein
MARRLHIGLAVFALVALWTAAAAEEKAPAPALPPVVPPPTAAPYVIESVAVHAAPQTGALRGTMSVSIRHLDAGQDWVPLFTGNVGVLEVKASGGGWFGTSPVVMRRGNAVGLLLTGRGTFSVDLDFATRLTTDHAANSAPVPMVPALSSVYDVTLEGESLNVSLEPALPLQKESGAGKTVVRIYGTAEGEVMLRWEPAPQERAVETIAFASQQQVLSVSAGLLHVEAQIDYSLLQGLMPQALVGLPEGYSLLKVSGDDVRTWDTRKEPSGASTLVVTLNDPAAATSRLGLTLEKTLPAVPVVIEAPQITVQGVAREKGLIAVALEKGLQAEIAEKQDIGQVDLSELAGTTAEKAEGVSLALRYLTRPYKLTLRISTIEPKVYGEVSCLTVVSMERLRQSWDIQYEIRNAGLFRLQLKLAPGMKVVGLRGDNINNQSLDPSTNVLTVDLRSKAEGAYRLSLQTYSDVADPANAVLPALELAGVERQWGTIGVSADSGISVEPGQMTGASQIDVGELKGSAVLQEMVQKQAAPAPMLAFRYLSTPYSLRLAISHITPELRCEPQHYVQITSKNLRYQSVFDYHIKKAGVFQLRLHVPQELRGNLTVKGDRVEDYSYDAPSQTLTIQLAEKTMDDVQVTLESEMLLPAELPAPGKTQTLAVPAVYSLDCQQERGYIAVGTDESIRLKRSGEGAALHDVDVQEIPPTLVQKAPNAKLAFRIIEAPWDLSLEVTSIPPKIQAQTFNYVRFGEDYLIGASTIEFSIQYAGVKEFRVRLPKGVTEPNIRGANIKIQEKVKAQPGANPEAPAFDGLGDVWRVELQSEVKGAYQLIFEYTMDLDPKQDLRAFTGPQVYGVMPEVEREIGYLAVTGDPSLELTPVADKLKGLTPVDEEEIPIKFRQLPPSVASQIGRQTVPILFAFRYLQHPYELALDSVRHEEAEVVTAVVESCKLDTTLTREGNRITAMVAMVRSRYQPFFAIRLPKDAQLWHALVNGVRVRPLTEQTSEGEVTKVPIAQVQGVRGPVRVELQWEEVGAQKLARVGDVRLDVPSLLGMRILRLGWVLQLPRGYVVVSSSGTLQRLPGENDFESSLRALKPTTQPGAAAGLNAAADQAQAADMQQASNLAVLTGQAGGKMPEPVPAFAASKPELPEHFFFQGLILNPQAPARVSALAVEGPALKIILALEVLALLALCGTFWALVPAPAAARFVALVAAAVIAAGLNVIAEGDYGPFLQAAIWTIGAAAVALGGMHLARRLRAGARRQEEARPEPPAIG